MMIMIRMTDEWEDGRRGPAGVHLHTAGLPNLGQKKEEADRKQQHKEGPNE